MADGTDIFDIIHTTRSMRRLKPDPVPDALIRRILEAGQCAPSGGNAQRWRFLVIKDPAIKKAVQVWYQKAFDEVIGPRYRTSAPPPGVDAPRYSRAADATRSASGPIPKSRYSSTRVNRQLGSHPTIGVPARAWPISRPTFSRARSRPRPSSPFEIAGRPQHGRPASSTR